MANHFRPNLRGEGSQILAAQIRSYSSRVPKVASVRLRELVVDFVSLTASRRRRRFDRPNAVAVGSPLNAIPFNEAMNCETCTYILCNHGRAVTTH